MQESESITIAEIDGQLRLRVQPLVDGAWAGPMIAVNGSLWDTRSLPGFAAVTKSGAVAGYLLYASHSSVCEIMVLESLRKGSGIGTQLIERVKSAARERGIQKMIVMTTNDNIGAIRFYQKRGFTLRALRVNALEQSRKLKPGIPLTGSEGIPLRDEIEFELDLFL